jgi:RimJ/RimL family protein N-acetyltransferase
LRPGAARRHPRRRPDGEPALELETARLSLRALGAGDVDALHALCVDPRVRRHLFDDRILSRDEVAEIVRASEASFAARGFGHFGLRLRGEPALRGLCGLAYLERLGGVEILYLLDPSLWGRGLACEAARAVLAFGFEKAGLERILGETDLPNGASLRLLERLGMTRTGEIELAGKRLVHYALSRERWLAQPVR